MANDAEDIDPKEHAALPVAESLPSPANRNVKGNGAALINHRRRGPNCCLLREKGKVWIIAGVEGIEAGVELTYDYGSDYYPRNGPKRPATLKR